MYAPTLFSQEYLVVERAGPCGVYSVHIYYLTSNDARE